MAPPEPTKRSKKKKQQPQLVLTGINTATSVFCSLRQNMGSPLQLLTPAKSQDSAATKLNKAFSLLHHKVPNVRSNDLSDDEEDDGNEEKPAAPKKSKGKNEITSNECETADQEMVNYMKQFLTKNANPTVTATTPMEHEEDSIAEDEAPTKQSKKRKRSDSDTGKKEQKKRKK